MPALFALPDAQESHPITLPDGTRHAGTVHLNRVIAHPRFAIGDYTYASDFDPPEDWAARLAPYLFAVSAETLRIGRFCQIAQGVRFITASANHQIDGLSAYPFAAMDPERRVGFQPDRRDTVIGHDVWLGFGAMVLPGASIGNGAIVGAGSVVRGAVPDYAVVIGNPGRVVRMRFAEAEVARLNALAWWDWPPEALSRGRAALEAGDLKSLETCAP
ncbi:CatB-related O-acetyltransferase [Sagittula salina]|uniref:CatB-related O-acetyltransferase n=1 Tax=Sagittula salina TaxID=2820268 RepID=A0A940MQP1_9RHOB|nr:CatB-related O-acetyltransferase [Sagittula salina]MBP0481304.1 CatB-related O-acetyltransferase [Sagittula salina]